MPKDTDRSSLNRYDIRDFWFSGLKDSEERHDVTYNVDTTKHVTIIPRERVITTARDRFTKASEKATRVPVIRRLGLTDRPSSFGAATTRFPDRVTTIGNPPAKKATTQALSRTLHHFDQPQHPQAQHPGKPGRGLR